MKICVRGYEPIEIPPELIAYEQGAFGDETPYLAKLVSRLGKPSYRENKLPSKLLCLESIKDKMLNKFGGYSSFAEPLAGVGLSARIFDRKGSLHLRDFDEGCVKVLEHNFSVPTIARCDMFTTELPKVDAIFLDFNNFTLKRYCQGHPYAAVLDGAFRYAKKFVILNDCSIFYFRYGKQSFDVYAEMLKQPIASDVDYFAAMARYWFDSQKEWRVGHIAYFKDSAFVLFVKDNPDGVEIVKAALPGLLESPMVAVQ